jgi:hypothetical protein
MCYCGQLLRTTHCVTPHKQMLRKSLFSHILLMYCYIMKSTNVALKYFAVSPCAVLTAVAFKVRSHSPQLCTLSGSNSIPARNPCDSETCTPTSTSFLQVTEDVLLLKAGQSRSFYRGSKFVLSEGRTVLSLPRNPYRLQVESSGDSAEAVRAEPRRQSKLSRIRAAMKSAMEVELSDFLCRS